MLRSWQIPRLLHFSFEIFGWEMYFLELIFKNKYRVCRVASFCVIYIYFLYFWWNYIHSLFFFWYVLLWISGYLELVFVFLKKEFTLSVFSVFSFKQSIDFGISRKNNTVERQPESSQSEFRWEKPCISHVVTKYTIKYESDGRKISIG